jgi:hypothetical protein
LPAEPLDRLRVEEVGAVLPDDLDPLVRLLLDPERQVEARGPGIRVERLGALESQRRVRNMREEDLEERMAARVPLRL